MKPKRKAKNGDGVDIYDATIPLGKRKQSFVKWLMRKGVALGQAKLICSRKFYYGEPR